MRNDKKLFTRWSIVLGAGLGTALALLPRAWAEMVYDTQPQQQQQQLQQVQVQPAPVMIQQPAQVYQATAPVAVQAAPVVVAQPATPAVVQAAPVQQQVQVEEPTLSRSELMRRERMRREMQSEDVLQSRMEALRLRDEERRTQALIQGETLGADTVQMRQSSPQYQAASQYAQPQQMQTINVSPALETATVNTAPVVDGPTRFGVAPHVGFAAMSGNSFLNMTPRSSYGIGVTAYSGQMAFDADFTYSQYGVGLLSSNYIVQALQYQYVQYQNQPVVLSQNVIDAGARFFLLNEDSKVRPFIGGGLGYAKGYINYNQGLQSLIGAYYGQDYQMDQWLAQVTAGAEIKMGKNFGIKLQGKYYFIMSSQQTQPNYGLYNMYPQFDQMIAANALSNLGFYTLGLGLTYTF